MESKLYYVWKGTVYEDDGEYTFYPSLEDAKYVFNMLVKDRNETDAFTYGVAEFDKTANNCLMPTEILGSYNL